MRKFDTKVQYLKYKVLREVARQAWNDTLLDNVMSIPRELAPRNAETIYCCVYKEPGEVIPGTMVLVISDKASITSLKIQRQLRIKVSHGMFC